MLESNTPGECHRLNGGNRQVFEHGFLKTTQRNLPQPNPGALDYRVGCEKPVRRYGEAGRDFQCLFLRAARCPYRAGRAWSARMVCCRPDTRGVAYRQAVKQKAPYRGRGPRSSYFRTAKFGDEPVRIIFILRLSRSKHIPKDVLCLFRGETYVHIRSYSYSYR